MSKHNRDRRRRPTPVPKAQAGRVYQAFLDSLLMLLGTVAAVASPDDVAVAEGLARMMYGDAVDVFNEEMDRRRPTAELIDGVPQIRSAGVVLVFSATIRSIADQLDEAASG